MCRTGYEQCGAEQGNEANEADYQMRWAGQNLEFPDGVLDRTMVRDKDHGSTTRNQNKRIMCPHCGRVILTVDILRLENLTSPAGYIYKGWW